jgi:hypothetical protein
MSKLNFPNDRKIFLHVWRDLFHLNLHEDESKRVHRLILNKKKNFTSSKSNNIFRLIGSNRKLRIYPGRIYVNFV